MSRERTDYRLQDANGQEHLNLSGRVQEAEWHMYLNKQGGPLFTQKYKIVKVYLSARPSPGHRRKQ